MITMLALALPVLCVLAGLPLWLDRVAPNRWYGYRTRLTLQDPAAWYTVNRELGIALVAAGIAGLAIAVVLLRLTPQWRGETRLLTTIIAQAVVLLVALMAVVIRTQRL